MRLISFFNSCHSFTYSSSGTYSPNLLLADGSGSVARIMPVYSHHHYYHHHYHKLKMKNAFHCCQTEDVCGAQNCHVIMTKNKTKWIHIARVFRTNDSQLQKWNMSSNYNDSKIYHTTRTNAFYKNVIYDYLHALRPKTIMQAVGSFLVGRFILLANDSTGTVTNLQFIQQDGKVLLFAILSIYISYGGGMVMNDAADVDLDAKSEDKRLRAVASGRISKRCAILYCAFLSMTSLVMGSLVSLQFALWTMMNLSLMFGYAIGLQKIPLVKNAICGLLAISPLVGASLRTNIDSDRNSILLLTRVALLGFMMQFSREILKDMEDIDIDKGKKMTLPMLIGERASHRVAYSFVAISLIMSLFIPHYWYQTLFATSATRQLCQHQILPLHYFVYPFAVSVAIFMCTKASMLPVNQGQKLVKNSINVLLAGMISTLVISR